MGKFHKKTSATPANVSRSSRCKTTRRQRLAARAEERAIIESAITQPNGVMFFSPVHTPKHWQAPKNSTFEVQKDRFQPSAPSADPAGPSKA